MTTRDDFRFFHPLRVRWNECDAQGIVFNVNYFLYYDIAVFEYTRALGYPTPLEAPEFVTARAEADFKGSAVFDDELEIAVRTARLGRKSMVAEGAVFRGDDLFNVGRLTYVQVRKGTTETAPLDPDYVERILAYEKTAPETAGGAHA